jgi:hypothetical protein
MLTSAKLASLLRISAVLCMPTSTASALVTQPEQARQSSSEICAVSRRVRARGCGA